MSGGEDQSVCREKSQGSMRGNKSHSWHMQQASLFNVDSTGGGNGMMYVYNEYELCCVCNIYVNKTIYVWAIILLYIFLLE